MAKSAKRNYSQGDTDTRKSTARDATSQTRAAGAGTMTGRALGGLVVSRARKRANLRVAKAQVGAPAGMMTGGPPSLSPTIVGSKRRRLDKNFPPVESSHIRI